MGRGGPPGPREPLPSTAAAEQGPPAEGAQQQKNAVTYREDGDVGELRQCLYFVLMDLVLVLDDDDDDDIQMFFFMDLIDFWTS